MLPYDAKKLEGPMTFNLLDKTNASFLKMTLNAYSTRHKAIAKNVTNVETENYHPIKVTFEENLQRALAGNRFVGRTSHERHLTVGGNAKEVSAEVQVEDRLVNIESEMAELAKNQIRFEFVARKLRSTYDSIRTSIVGRF
jgi:flagellar basal-body rod protein FlgB